MKSSISIADPSVALPMTSRCLQQAIYQLRQARLFRDLDDATLELLADKLETKTLECGEILLSPYSRNHYLYVLQTGLLEIHIGEAETPAVARVEPGDCAGEVSFIDNRNPSAYVVAGESSTVLRLHRDGLFSLAEQIPELMRNLLGLLCDRVRQGNRIIRDSEHSANLDALTGLANRRALRQIYDRESTRCAYNESPLCALMLDVDHFKHYNDQHGHLAGDHALTMVANTLGAQLRPKDTMARYGGEEFVILLPDLSPDAARDIGERLRRSLEEAGQFHSPLGPQPGVTISLGLSLMQRDDSLETLLERADQALYQAKREGRNRLCG